MAMVQGLGGVAKGSGKSGPVQSDGHYMVKTHCSNCGWDGETVIKMGTPVGKAKCEGCGCTDCLWHSEG